jgi:hypothetical protein
MFQPLACVVRTATLVRGNARHPERSAAESKGPAKVILKIVPRDPSTSLGATGGILPTSTNSVLKLNPATPLHSS